MKPTPTPVALRECDCLQSSGVDEAQPVIKRVKILGWESKNRRRYLPESVSTGLYEGRLVNLDHPDNPSQSRRVGERFGRLRNVEIDGDGCWGDLHYNPKHPLAEMVRWAAENDPAQLGLSHNAMGTGETQAGVFVVHKVVNVRSVDLVADPATTKGLHEAMEPDVTPPPGEGQDSVDDLATHISNAVQALVKDDSLDLKTKMKKIKAALKLLEEPGAGEDEDVEEEDEEKDKEEKEYEEAVQLLRQSKDPKVKKLVERHDRLSAATKLAARRDLAVKLCEDAHLPRVLVSEVFLETLVQAKDEAAMKKLVEDRKAVGSIQKPRSTAPNPTSTPKGKPDMDVAGFARQLREGR